MKAFSGRQGNVPFVLLSTIAGFVCGALTAAICDVHFSYSLGVPFGAMTALYLAITGVTRSSWRLLCFFVLVTCTLYISDLFAGMVQLLVGGSDKYSPIALFAGGMVGGFIILTGARIFSRSNMRITAVLWEALCWSTLAGILSPVAWALGPSLGMYVWSALHAVGLTSPADTFSEALYGETGNGPPNRLFALFVLWQTGMSFALGMTLRNVRRMGETSSWEDLKLT